MTEENNLEKLKKAFGPLKKKYSLPEFKYLNENFEVELVSEDTDTLLKRIRKQIMEKVFWNLRTLETFLNPQSAPIFIFNIIKTLTTKDKEMIGDLYKKLAEYEVEAFRLEAIYNEKAEADFIKSVGKDWKQISEELDTLGKSMKENYNLEFKKQSKSYFG